MRQSNLGGLLYRLTRIKRRFEPFKSAKNYTAALSIRCYWVDQGDQARSIATISTARLQLGVELIDDGG